MVALEKAEQQIDQFIERRAREAKDAAVVEELREESARRERERQREENRTLWREYEQHLERVHMDLALEHRTKAEALAEGGYEPEEAPSPKAA